MISQTGIRLHTITWSLFPLSQYSYKSLVLASFPLHIEWASNDSNTCSYVYVLCKYKTERDLVSFTMNLAVLIIIPIPNFNSWVYLNYTNFTTYLKTCLTFYNTWNSANKCQNVSGVGTAMFGNNRTLYGAHNVCSKTFNWKIPEEQRCSCEWI